METELALFEFDDSINARDPPGVAHGGSLGCDDFEHDIQALLWGEGAVVLAVGGFGGGVGGEFADDGLHQSIISYC